MRWPDSTSDRSISIRDTEASKLRDVALHSAPAIRGMLRIPGGAAPRRGRLHQNPACRSFGADHSDTADESEILHCGLSP